MAIIPWPIKISGEWAKPVNTLIERVFNIFERRSLPGHTVRQAQAEAEAAIIRAKADAECTAIQVRGLKWLIAEQGLHQANREDILRGALPHVLDDARPSDIEEDWIVHFFDRCRLVSDATMQRLWSRLLADEANTPGTFSKRTLNLVSEMSAAEAKKFELFCAYVVHLPQPVPLITDERDVWYTQAGIDTDLLQSLSSAGLLTWNLSEGFTVRTDTGAIHLSYGGCIFKIEQPDAVDLRRQRELNRGSVMVPQGRIPVGKVMFTPSGQELYLISSPKVLGGFPEILRRFYAGRGFTFSEAQRPEEANELAKAKIEADRDRRPSVPRWG